MRIKAEFWIKAYLRRVMSAGAYATIVRHGDDDAGSVLIVVRTLDGKAALYAPAPTALLAEGQEMDRVWAAALVPGTPEQEVERRVSTEKGFDPDLWVVEVEDRAGRHFLDGSLLSA